MKIFTDMTNAQYHAHPAVSKSLLDKIARSPLHARAYLDGTREEPTASMNFGTALHTAVLEPERYAGEYAVFEGDRRTTAGKKAYEELMQKGATIISAADHGAISAMVASIQQHQTAGAMIECGHAETSVFWEDPVTGIECKCRPDYWRREYGVVVDLKTTDDASPEAFARSVASYRYHVQAAHYMEGTRATRFVFVAVEKKPPYAVAVYELDADSLKAGRILRERDIASIASCREFNVWPGYSEHIQTLSLPRWAQGGEE